MMENREDRPRRPSEQQTSITHRSMNSSHSSHPRSTSSSAHSDSHDTESESIELQEAPQRSLSVGHREHTTVQREEVESWSSRRSSLGIQPERHHVGSLLRRSLLQRNPRSESMASNAPPATEAVSPSTLRISRTSSFGFPRPESPYQGATGPSHPYGMYTQDTSVSRAPSTATASFVQRPERTYSGPSGPTQPYSMYPQNTVEEDEQPPFGGSMSLAPTAYPAGARPAPQAHHRRLGPDGEDLDDLVGPYGYAEQLPPYSRYPNDIPPKRDPDASSFVNGEASSSIPHQNASQNTINNLAPLPLPTSTSIPSSEPTPYSESSTTEVPSHRSNASNENAATAPIPEIRLQTGTVAGSGPDLSSPQSNPFSDTSTQGSSTAIGSSTASEKGSIKKRIRKRAKKRCCWGMVPCWLLVFVAALIIAVCVGGILGGVLAHDTNVQTTRSKSIDSGAKPVESQPTVTVTSIIPAQTPDDADPITAVSGLPAIPTGSFTVTLDEPSTTSNSCLTDALQNNAWDCSTGANLNVTIAMQNNAPYISLTYPMKPGQIQYGAQPPQLSGPSSLLYIKDKSSFGSRRGNSYGFKQPFNKTVIVRSQDFPGAMAKRSLRWAFRRWLNHHYEERSDSAILEGRELQQSDWNMTSLASASDRPWLCTWNGTFLTGFIYVSTSVTQQLQYPKSMKILEKRPSMNPPPATCQQMEVQKDFTLTPLEFDDGSYNIVILDEESANADEDDDDPANHAARPRKPKRQITGQIGGPRCECAWQST